MFNYVHIVDYGLQPVVAPTSRFLQKEGQNVVNMTYNNLRDKQLILSKFKGLKKYFWVLGENKS